MGGSTDRELTDRGLSEELTDELRVRVRPATAADVEAICRICAEGWRDTYRGLRSEAEIESVIGEFYVPERVSPELAPAPPGWGGWLVAEDRAGEVIGAGAGGMTGPAVGELFVLYVDPARQRQGAGRALLDAITERQRTLGAREQWVSVEDNNRKGIGFYESRGFVPAGTRPAYELSGESLRYMRTLD